MLLLSTFFSFIILQLQIFVIAQEQNLYESTVLRTHIIQGENCRDHAYKKMVEKMTSLKNNPFILEDHSKIQSIEVTYITVVSG